MHGRRSSSVAVAKVVAPVAEKAIENEVVIPLASMDSVTRGRDGIGAGVCKGKGVGSARPGQILPLPGAGRGGNWREQNRRRRWVRWTPLSNAPSCLSMARAAEPATERIPLCWGQNRQSRFAESGSESFPCIECTRCIETRVASAARLISRSSALLHAAYCGTQ